MALHSLLSCPTSLPRPLLTVAFKAKGLNWYRDRRRGLRTAWSKCSPGSAEASSWTGTANICTSVKKNNLQLLCNEKHSQQHLHTPLPWGARETTLEIIGKEGELADACWLPEITRKTVHNEVTFLEEIPKYCTRDNGKRSGHCGHLLVADTKTQFNAVQGCIQLCMRESPSMLLPPSLLYKINRPVLISTLFCLLNKSNTEIIETKEFNLQPLAQNRLIYPS